MRTDHINPAITETLTQLMLGGLPTGRNGFPLHARFRYFDGDLRRPGIPEDCAALVEKLGADSATLSLVNLGDAPRTYVRAASRPPPPDALPDGSEPRAHPCSASCRSG